MSSSRRVRRILVVVADQHLSDSIITWLDEALKDPAYSVLTDAVRTESEARRRLSAQRYHLVIAEIGIPADKNSPRNDKERRGLELVRSLRSPVASILLAPLVDASLYDTIHNFHKCVAVETSMNLEERLVRYTREALSKAASETADEKFRITFTLDTDNLPSGSCCIEGVGFAYRYTAAIQVDAKTMKDLIEKSRIAAHLTEYPLWEAYLRELGEQLIQKFFFDNYVSLEYGKVVAGRKTEIVFDIARGTHPIIFEALVDPESMSLSPEAGGKTFWMLKAPIYRRLRHGIATNSYPLFQGLATQGPINCLLIESQVDGLVAGIKNEDGTNLTLSQLPNVPIEAQALERYLKEHRDEFGLGEILRISANRVGDKEVNRSGEDTMMAWLHAELTRSDLDWHLVHYAGHCHHDEAKGRGYVFFPGDSLGEALELDIFSAWLSRTRFLYLSGCRSSAEAFVFELAYHNVPAVLGFRWDIEDGPAAKYTELFYEQLFKVHNLEYAYFQARLELRKTGETKRSWAAPMLIMQQSNSLGVAS